jgi:hypothetical protein
MKIKLIDLNDWFYDKWLWLKSFNNPQATITIYADDCQVTINDKNKFFIRTEGRVTLNVDMNLDLNGVKTFRRDPEYKTGFTMKNNNITFKK